MKCNDSIFSEVTPKISVIVPMYNVEKYLKLCISSILNQTFKDFELILIDDCSTDKTLEVAKSFTDSRIKILRNEKNLGKPGPVRNVGIDAAQGKYIYFCDSDDAILPNSLEIFYNTAETYQADAVNTTRWFVAKKSDFTNLENLELNIHTISKLFPVAQDIKTRLYQEFLQNHIHISPGLFLYRRKFLTDNNIKFPNEVAEDVFFNFDVVCATSKIAKIEVPLYIVRLNPDSVSHNPKRLQKNVKSIPVLSAHIEEKLSPLQDRNFVQMILMYWISHVTNTHVVPQYTNGGGTALQALLEGLEPRFGKDSPFVLTLFQLYFQGFSALRENQFLKINLNKLVSENQMLKNKLANIEQILKA